MFDRVTLRVSDRDASGRFYATVLGPLAIAATHRGDDLAWDDFSIARAGDGHPVTRGLHIAFVAPTREHADMFWNAGTGAGHRSDGAPGARPEYGGDYYGAFLRDPDGNSVEAVHREGLRRDGNVDHLWIRVADVARARAFYSLVAPHAGFRPTTDLPERAQFSGPPFSGGTFSLVAGEPTERVHVAFGVTGDAPVHAFHRAAVEAGYRDNGAPGERPAGHPGSFGASVLDPDGNDVEVVNHRR